MDYAATRELRRRMEAMEAEVRDLDRTLAHHLTPIEDRVRCRAAKSALLGLIVDARARIDASRHSGR